MGKKNKKLKKKKQYNAPAQNSATVTDPIIEKIKSDVINPAPEEEIKGQYEDKEYLYIRKDIRKILTIMLVIILFTIGLYYLDQKTSYLYQAGDWLYKIFNITTQ